MAKPQPDDMGLFYVDARGKFTTAENAVVQYTESDARARGLLTDEPEAEVAPKAAPAPRATTSPKGRT